MVFWLLLLDVKKEGGYECIFLFLPIQVYIDGFFSIQFSNTIIEHLHLINIFKITPKRKQRQRSDNILCDTLQLYCINARFKSRTIIYGVVFITYFRSPSRTLGSPANLHKAHRTFNPIASLLLWQYCIASRTRHSVSTFD